MKEIHIARDYSKFPAGRHLKDGEFSGERFRKKHLEPPLKKGLQVVVYFDGARGYGSSFLDEAFGGLIRTSGFRLATLLTQLELIGSDPGIIHEVWSYLKQEEQKIETQTHAQTLTI